MKTDSMQKYAKLAGISQTSLDLFRFLIPVRCDNDFNRALPTTDIYIYISVLPTYKMCII